MIRPRLLLSGWLLLAAVGAYAGDFKHEKFIIDPATRVSLPRELALGWLQKTPKQDTGKFSCRFQDEGIRLRPDGELQTYASMRVTDAFVWDEGGARALSIKAMVRIAPKDGGLFNFCEALWRKYDSRRSETHTMGPLRTADLPLLVRDVTRTLEALAVLGVDISEVEATEPPK